MHALTWRDAMAHNSRLRRIMIVMLTFALMVAIVFMQAAFLHVGEGDGVCVLLLLVPIALAAILLGTITGTLLGASAGVLTYAHTVMLPLDFEELLYANPVMLIALYGIFGLVMGLSWASLPSRSSSTLARVIRVVLSCALASICSTIFVAVAFVSSPDYGVAALQAALSTIITALPCIAVYLVVRHVIQLSDNISTRGAFSLSIFIVVLVAFMVVATISYVSVTLEERKSAEAAMKSEVNYICLQLEAMRTRTNAYGEVSGWMGIPQGDLATLDVDAHELIYNTVGAVLSGYTMEQTGTVMILSGNELLATDDMRLREGADVAELLGQDVASAIELAAANGEMRPIVYDGVLNTDEMIGGYGHAKQLAYVVAQSTDYYTAVIIEPSSKVYRDRPSYMGREAATALIILAVIYIVVTQLLSRTVVNRIDQTNESLQRITAGELDERVEVAGTKEFKSLSAGINQTVDALDRLIKEAETRMEKDLKTATAIQEGALPRRFPAFPDVAAIDLYASMDAAKEVGGDFYDFFAIDDHTVAFLIADVSGKGIPGALFMMAAKAAIQNELGSGVSLSDAMSKANAYLCEHNEAGMFVTVWAATLNWKTGLLTYVNAGHNYPLLRHGHKGTWEWLDQRCGLFLGLFDMCSYSEKTLQLEPGDELLLYTDGVNEAFSVEAEEFGNDRLEAFLGRHTDSQPKELVGELRAEVAAWAEGAEQSDDITILALEYCA